VCRKSAAQALDQPGAEGVDALQPAEIDVDRSRTGIVACGLVDEPFQLGGALCGPGAGGDEVEPLALDAGGARGVRGVAVPRRS